MLNRLCQWWTYSRLNPHGKLRMLADRKPDPTAFIAVYASQADIERSLGMICDSFAIDLTQQFCLRPQDKLADIYHAMTKYQLHDDMEYERLFMAITDVVGEFETTELSVDFNLTVQGVIEFVSRRLTEKRTT